MENLGNYDAIMVHLWEFHMNMWIVEGEFNLWKKTNKQNQRNRKKKRFMDVTVISSTFAVLQEERKARSGNDIQFTQEVIIMRVSFASKGLKNNSAISPDLIPLPIAQLECEQAWELCTNANSKYWS